MKRDAFKFLSGMFAGFAIEHAVIAVFIAQGDVGKPHYFGREWGAGSGLLGAVLYSAIGLWLGYLGWRSVRSPAEANTTTTKSPR